MKEDKVLEVVDSFELVSNRNYLLVKCIDAFANDKYKKEKLERKDFYSTSTGELVFSFDF